MISVFFAIAFCNLVNLVKLAPTEGICGSPRQLVDFIIVGAGSSGSALASRLSEMSSVYVLLLEAGEEPSDLVDVPFRTRDVLMDPESNWNYYTEPQKYCCSPYPHQVLNLPSGRGLGGSSNLNGMIFTRGHRYDYDRLKEMGITGWSYKDILPIFKSMENYQVLHRRSDHSYHGYEGIQTITSPVYQSEMANAFLQAGAELNYFSVDVNAQHQLGFTTPPVNIKDGVRWGAYRAYLERAKNRLNLQILTKATVTKILIDSDKRAVGVTYLRDNTECTVYAEKEIIISAGAIRSPHLLMNSGIGSSTHLEQVGIPLVHDLPGVGQNLKDHVFIAGINYYLDFAYSMNFTRLNSSENMDLWTNTKTGPMTSPNGVEGISFFRSDSYVVTNHSDHPTYEISFYSDQSVFSEMFKPMYKNVFIEEPGKDAVTLLPILLQPKSVGEVRLRSKNPLDFPKVDPNYLSNPLDKHLLLEILRIAHNIGKSKSFQKYGAKLIGLNAIPGCNHLKPDFDDFWLCFVEKFAVAAYHFVGTCKMSSYDDKMGVVDSRLKVFGVKGLRVADASVLPELPSGHVHAVALLVGERAAEFIKKEHWLVK